jgi:hypothetical protein
LAKRVFQTTQKPQRFKNRKKLGFPRVKERAFQENQGNDHHRGSFSLGESSDYSLL